MNAHPRMSFPPNGWLVGWGRRAGGDVARVGEVVVACPLATALHGDAGRDHHLYGREVRSAFPNGGFSMSGLDFGLSLLGGLRDFSICLVVKEPNLS